LGRNSHIVACELTTPDAGDSTCVPDLLAQIDTPFDTFMADGTYDGDPVSQAVLEKQANEAVVIPPHKTVSPRPPAIPNETSISKP